MDDMFYMPLTLREDTPSLCSNVTLWEMHDIEPTEPLLLSDSNNSGQTPSRSNFVLLGQRFQWASNVNFQHKSIHREYRWPFGAPRTYAELSNSTPFDRMTQGHAGDTSTSQQARASVRITSGAHDMLVPRQDPPSETSFMKR